MDLISVIVPVYKVEKYLDRCVESIANQTYKNLEIILVDDGSPDNCPAMCDAWAKRDKRIKVIHKANGGSGEARNVALDIAKGSLITFVDSDDYISVNMYEYLHSLIVQDADIAECGYMEVLDDCRDFMLDIGKITVYSSGTAMKEHVEDNVFRQLIWNKLYRKEVVGNIRFPIGTQIDDEFWTYRVLANARKLVHSTSVMYAYRQQLDSVMHRSFTLSRLQALDAKCMRLEMIKERFPALISTAKINLWQTCLFMGQMSLIHMNEKEQKEAFDLLRDVLDKYPISAEKKLLPLKQKIWLSLNKISFVATCKIRNLFKIGL